MHPSIHGHEVIHMMMASGIAYSVESLTEAVHERFGAETRFHTCSAENMTARELISFLQDRGKFTPVDGGFAFNPEKMCNHE